MAGVLNRRYVIGISLVSALGGFLFGYDWVVIGGAKIFYERFFDITDIPHLQGLAMSSALIGCIPGAILAGYLGDKNGRKRTLIMAAVLYLISALGTGYASDFATFLVFRILGGLAIGIASCISPVYIAEVSPESVRGKLVSLNQLNIVVGILIAQVSNFLIARPVADNATNEMILNSWNGQFGWRWMFWAETIPAAVFLAFSLLIPESPRWLVKSKRPMEAGRILQKIGGKEYSLKILSEIQDSLDKASRRLNLRVLLDKKLSKVLVLGLVLAIFQQWCGINIVFNYAEEVFTAAGFGIDDALFNIILTGTVNLVFTFIAIRTVDRWGRRKLMIFGASGLAITYILLGAAYYAKLNGVIVLLIIVTAIAIYAMSLAPVTWVILSEIFPNRIRGAAMAVATATLWIASTLLVLLFPLIKVWINISGAFWLYSAICLAGLVFVFRRLPETKGKSLEDIQKLFDGQKK